MKTNQITRGAMLCAIYGVLLFLNQQTALLVETSASWLFVFPILVYTGMNGGKPGFLVGSAMACMTILFGGFTTWFYSWTSIVTGYIYGLGLYKGFRNGTNLAICFVFSLLSNVCIVFVWSALFGIDVVEEFHAIKDWIPFVDLRVFAVLFVLVLGSLQALCVHLVALVLAQRFNIRTHAIRPISEHPSSKFFGIVSLIIWGVFFLTQNMVSCSKGITDFIQIVWFVDCAVLLYYGVVYFMNYCVVKNLRKFAFLAIFLAFIPGINLIWMLAGELDCLFQIRNRLYKR